MRQISPSRAGNSSGVAVAVFRQFYEEWRKIVSLPALQMPAEVVLETREALIKAQPMVRIKELGIGTLILTHLYAGHCHHRAPRGAVQR